MVYWKRPNSNLELVDCGLTQMRLIKINEWRKCQSDNQRALLIRDRPYLKGYPEVQQWDKRQPVFDPITAQHAYTDAEEARALQEEGQVRLPTIHDNFIPLSPPERWTDTQMQRLHRAAPSSPCEPSSDVCITLNKQPEDWASDDDLPDRTRRRLFINTVEEEDEYDDNGEITILRRKITRLPGSRTR